MQKTVQTLAKENNLDEEGSLWCGSIDDWALSYNEETAGDVVESALAEVGSTWKEPGRVKELAEIASKDRNMKGQQLCLAVAAAQDILHNCSRSSEAQVQMLAPELLNSCCHCRSRELTLKDWLAARIDKEPKSFKWLQLSSERHLRKLMIKEQPKPSKTIPLPPGPVDDKSRPRSRSPRGVWKE